MTGILTNRLGDLNTPESPDRTTQKENTTDYVTNRALATNHSQILSLLSTTPEEKSTKTQRGTEDQQILQRNLK